jgi:hypothetical protein
MFGRSRPGVHPTHLGEISGVQVMELERGWGGETGEREDIGRAEARRHSHASSAGFGVWLGPAGLLIRDVFPMSVSSSRNTKAGELNGPQWLRVLHLCTDCNYVIFPRIGPHHRANHHHVFFPYIA